MRRRHYGKIFFGLVLVLVLCQLIPVERSNPPVTAEIKAPAAVAPLLRRACYDCHSNETVWPGYSRVAPISWLVANDVSEGRDHLNFSTWGELPAARQAKRLREIGKALGEGEMPPWYYLPMHPQARLNDTEKTRLLNWAGYRGGAEHDD